MMGLSIPSILFGIAIAASASPYPRALPDWNAFRDIGVFYPPTMTEEQPSRKQALFPEPRETGSQIPVWSPRPTSLTPPAVKAQPTTSIAPSPVLYVPVQ